MDIASFIIIGLLLAFALIITGIFVNAYKIQKRAREIAGKIEKAADKILAGEENDDA